jgi:Rad3-related DNA helicase
MIEISEIEERLDDIVDIGTFGPNFSFRSQQKDTILQIADSYLNNKTKNIILAGPTGVGKSVIAIVTSKLLESFDNKGYVITSDILLQKQYDLDFKRMNLKYGTIMGVDNYICEVNRLKFSLGE